MPERHVLWGACHCRGIGVVLHTAIEPRALPLRACQCSFCRRELYVTCSAQRSGSGLRGLQATVLQSDGTTLIAAAPVETADEESTFGNAGTLPPNVPQMVLKVEATLPQDPSVTGTYYQCGASFGP